MFEGDDRPARNIFSVWTGADISPCDLNLCRKAQIVEQNVTARQNGPSVISGNGSRKFIVVRRQDLAKQLAYLRLAVVSASGGNDNSIAFKP